MNPEDPNYELHTQEPFLVRPEDLETCASLGRLLLTGKDIQRNSATLHSFRMIAYLRAMGLEDHFQRVFVPDLERQIARRERKYP